LHVRQSGVIQPILGSGLHQSHPSEATPAGVPIIK
jgi:hypothetical protein